MKKFLIIFGMLVCLIVLGISIFLMTFNINRYRGDIATKMTMLLGRPVQIESMDMKLAMVPTIHVHHMTISNPSSFSQETPFADIDQADITLALAPLLSNRVEIQDISLGKVRVNILNQSGKSNLNFVSQNAAINNINQNWLSNARVDSVSAKEVQINYNGKQNFSFPIINFSIKQLKVFSFQILMHNNSFKVSGTVNDIKDLIHHTPDYAFNFEATGAEMDIKVNGAIGDTSAFKKILLNTEVSGKSLKKTLELFGIKGKQYPAVSFKIDSTCQGDLKEAEIQKFTLALDKNKLESQWTGTMTQMTSDFKLEGSGTIQLLDWTLGQVWGIRPMAATITLSSKGEELDFKNILIQAGRSDIQLSGKINWTQEKPTLIGTVSSEYLDIQDVLLGDMTYATDPNQNTLFDIQNWFNDSPIDLSYLNKWNGSVNVAVPHLKFSDGMTDYFGIFGKVVLENGILSSNPLGLNLLNGTATASIALNTSDNHLYAQMVGKELDLNAIKELDFIIKDSKVDTSLTLETVGKTSAEWLGYLNAEIKAELSNGRIVSPWFNDLMDALFTNVKHSISYTTADRESKILCGAVSFKIENGQMTSDQNQVALETSRAALQMAGSVDFNNSVLNVMIKPYAVGQPIANLPDIKISGSMNSPDVELVPEQAGNNAFVYQPYSLCQSVLGHKAKTQVEEELKTQRMLPLPQVIENTENKGNDTFKQQLLETLKNR